MNIQEVFATHLCINRNMLACHEVAHYGHNCDVLAVDRNKELIFEYEFKASSNDLKVAELKKDKYKPYWCSYHNDISKKHYFGRAVYKEYKWPNYFYFVMPEELFIKEQAYLKSLRVGTMFYRENKTPNSHMNGFDFYVGKRTGENKRNPQNYQVAVRSIARRLSNVYAFGNSAKYYAEKRLAPNPQ